MSQPEKPQPAPQPPESFQTKKEAIGWMIDVNATRHKEARTKKSDRTRVYFECTKPACAFSCHINKNADGLFRVSRWSWHTCGVVTNPKVKRSWVVEKAKEKLGEIEGINPLDLQQSLKQTLGVDVEVPAARKAVRKARADRDAEEASFDKLPGLFQALADENPGTVTDIVMEEGRLKMAFLCPGPCVRAWSNCPKIIALDGTHGSSAFGGVVLVATALDGAGQIFPIAIGFVPSETNVAWRFFVRHLADALGIHNTPLAVISDRCKGIDKGVSEFLPRAAHSYCTFHIRQNMARFGTAAAEFIWTIANAGTEQEYNEAMATLGTISPEAKAYVEATVPKEHLVRAFFPMPRYGHVTSNIAEATNSALLKIRKYPPTKLFVKVIEKINATFAEKREKYADANPADLVGPIFDAVEKNIEDGRKLFARASSDNVFAVDIRPGIRLSRVVKLAERTCTCSLFQDLGYPCAHACSAALKADIDPHTLCIAERRVGALQAVYRAGIIPVDLETIPSLPLEAPLVQRQAGRPKVKRIRRQDRNRRILHFCSLCGEEGHTRRTCPNKEE